MEAVANARHLVSQRARLPALWEIKHAKATKNKKSKTGSHNCGPIKLRDNIKNRRIEDTSIL